MLYVVLVLVSTEDDFTVPPHNTETERISGGLELIGPGLALNCQPSPFETPIGAHLREPFVLIT